MDRDTVPAGEYRPDVVIYHDHCADGFAAAWACWMRWRDACQYVPASYGQAAPDVTGKHVLLVDFSYKRDVLKAMGQTARSVIVLDHHKTAQADLADWHIDDVAGDFWAGDDPMKLVRRSDDHIGQPIAALFDMDKSGARLAWEFCHDGEPPLLVRLIEDRDLWRFTMEDTKPFSLWLRSEPFSFDRFELLAQEMEDGHDGHRIMTEARAMQRFFDAKVEEMTSFARKRTLGEHEPITVNCPPMFASEVGHALLDKHPHAPFAAMYFDSPNRRMWSLRSRDDRVDVSAVAATYGGGGHRNAAGFSEELPTPATEPAGDTPRSAPAEVEVTQADREALQAAWDEYASWMGDPDGKDDSAHAFNQAAKIIARHRASSKSVEQSEVSRLRDLVKRAQKMIVDHRVANNASLWHADARAALNGSAS